MGKETAEGILDALAAWLEAESDHHFRLSQVARRETDYVGARWHDGRSDMAGAVLTELKRLRASQEAE